MASVSAPALFTPCSTGWNARAIYGCSRNARDDAAGAFTDQPSKAREP